MDWLSLKDKLRKLKDGGVDREEIKKQAEEFQKTKGIPGKEEEGIEETSFIEEPYSSSARKKAIQALKEKGYTKTAEVADLLLPNDITELNPVSGVKTLSTKMVPKAKYKPSQLAKLEAETDLDKIEDALDNYKAADFHSVRRAHNNAEYNISGKTLARGLKGATESTEYALEKPTTLYRYHSTHGYSPEDLKVGDEIVSDRLLSFTKDKKAVKEFLEDAAGSPDNYLETSNVIYKVNKATHGADVGGNEAEIIMPEGIGYKITKITQDRASGKPVVELQETTKRDLRSINKQRQQQEALPDVKSPKSLQLGGNLLPFVNSAKDRLEMFDPNSSAYQSVLNDSVKDVFNVYKANSKKWINEAEELEIKNQIRQQLMNR